jgi:FtsH Extracellular
MADAAHHHCTRPWYLRPPVWILGVVLLGLAAFAIVQLSTRPSPMALSYGAFLSQLDADNVASVTFSGTQVDGKFRQPVGQAATHGTTAKTIFRSQIPNIGDPTLIPELRKEHVVIDVASSSNWVSWLGRLPWPLVLLLAFLLVAGLVQLVRGKTSSATPTSMQAMPGPTSMLAGLFGKQSQSATPQEPRK